MSNVPVDMQYRSKGFFFLILTTLPVWACSVAWGQHRETKSAEGLGDVASEDPIRTVVDKQLPRLRATRKEREEAIKILDGELMAAWNSGRMRMPAATRKNLSEELTDLYVRTKDADFSHPAIRRGLIYNVVRYGDNEVGKPFILRILDRGTEGERTEALRALGAPGGISGPEIYTKVEELARRGVIKQEAKTTYLARIDKARALPQILNEISSTSDKRVFLYNAWALQDYYKRPEDFKKTIPRIKHFGLAKKGSFDGKSNGLFWIDAKLLAAYVDTAQGEDLRLALELMNQHSALIRPTSVPALSKQLDAADRRIRILVGQALETAADYTLEDASGIKALLRGAVDKEQDAEVKRLLQDSVSRIERREQGWRRVVEKNKDRLKK